jgi:hypothetical protein
MLIVERRTPALRIVCLRFLQPQRRAGEQRIPFPASGPREAVYRRDSLDSAVGSSRSQRWKSHIGRNCKTPLVIALAEGMKSRGLRPVILSRGIEEQSREILIAGSDWQQAGDEPCLMTQRLVDVPVVVAADRFEAGVFAERQKLEIFFCSMTDSSIAGFTVISTSCHRSRRMECGGSIVAHRTMATEGRYCPRSRGMRRKWQERASLHYPSPRSSLELKLMDYSKTMHRSLRPI